MRASVGSGSLSRSWFGRALPRNSVRRVVAAFAAWLCVLLPVVLLSGRWSGWSVLTETFASAGGLCARAIGIPAVVSGNVLHLSRRSLAIDPECTAITLFAVFAALVLAYPLPLKTKAIALGLGAPVLAAINVVRIAAVAVASEALSGESFYMVHDYLFEFGMVFVVLIMWAVWLAYARRTA